MEIKSQGNGFDFSVVGAPREATKITRDKVSVEPKEEKHLREVKNHSEKQETFSEDGDVLELSKEGLSKYSSNTKTEDGSRLSEAEEERRRASPRKNEKKEEEKAEVKRAEIRRELLEKEAKIKELRALQREESEKKKDFEPETSFAGKTDGDIAKMYLRGDISKAEYDEEIEARDIKRKEAENKERERYEGVLSASFEAEEMVRFEKELGLAFKKDRKEALSPADRLAQIEAASGEGKDKKEKEIRAAVG